MNTNRRGFLGVLAALLALPAPIMMGLGEKRCREGFKQVICWKVWRGPGFVRPAAIDTDPTTGITTFTYNTEPCIHCGEPVLLNLSWCENGVEVTKANTNMEIDGKKGVIHDWCVDKAIADYLQKCDIPWRQS